MTGAHHSMFGIWEKAAHLNKTSTYTKTTRIGRWYTLSHLIDLFVLVPKQANNARSLCSLAVRSAIGFRAQQLSTVHCSAHSAASLSSPLPLLLYLSPVTPVNSSRTRAPPLRRALPQRGLLGASSAPHRDLALVVSHDELTSPFLSLLL